MTPSDWEELRHGFLNIFVPGIVMVFICSFAAIVLLSGCASECAYKSNGYCYHVEGF